ncbi:MAG TPA: ATP-dependent sacrificial sulfur transferase LarE [Gemmatimonadaceae bacterium]|nr:ATP-dependent sacrificial sulfur transferase LarE [Gemmatimonadaceae bacterium]
MIDIARAPRPTSPADVEGKVTRLRDALASRGSLLVGFSGGVDSALLAVVAHDVLGERMLAVLGVSASLAADVHARARQIANDFGVPFREMATHELDDENYVANRGDRCFQCKQELWRKLAPLADVLGFAALADGTIVDDLSEHRPGKAAGARAGVWSPLAECGLTKDDVRAAARLRGIPIWNAPAAPCLSSRLATGVTVTTERLARVERAETALRALGITGDLRVRHLGDAARVELPAGSVAEWERAPRRAALAAAVHAAGFARVLLDRRGYRRGSVSTQERADAETGDVIEITSGPAPDTLPKGHA